VAAHEEGAQEFDDGGDDDGLSQREHLRPHRRTELWGIYFNK
jgi:hypothetical protein